ncbi:hypothetical protein PIB30_075925 [Stylosanthes scabra]|uniref:Retrotransposon gag domain-containing protein n=1 Tax=Stylosanthes scabra TaxID=79078 RepID=A0ABU6SR02_9FABA|nr:hypothetical protein [Stylosanthes scabra]
MAPTVGTHLNVAEYQQEELDLNATTNDVTGVDEANVDSGGVRNGRPHLPIANPGGRRIPSANDKIGSCGNSDNQEQHRSQTPRPFEWTSFPISFSLSPGRSRRSRTPSRRRRYHNSSEDKESSSEGDHEVTPPMDCHTPFLSQILKVQPLRHFIKLTNMKYDRSTDPHVHLNDFEHRMICDGAVDEVKCRAFLVTLTGLASQWFTSLSAVRSRAIPR